VSHSQLNNLSIWCYNPIPAQPSPPHWIPLTSS
jgi:hypothetical protein